MSLVIPIRPVDYFRSRSKFGTWKYDLTHWQQHKIPFWNPYIVDSCPGSCTAVTKETRSIYDQGSNRNWCMFRSTGMLLSVSQAVFQNYAVCFALKCYGTVHRLPYVTHVLMLHFLKTKTSIYFSLSLVEFAFDVISVYAIFDIQICSWKSVCHHPEHYHMPGVAPVIWTSTALSRAKGIPYSISVETVFQSRIWTFT